MKVVVRADASTAIGLGHATRAVAVAEELATLTGATPLFVGRPDPLLESFLAGRGLELLPVDSDGYGIEAVLDAVGADSALVSDSYDLTVEDLERIQTAGSLHLVVDDFALLGRFACDVVVNPNVGASQDAYPGVRALVGPSYALLRSDILAAACRRGPPRHDATRVLICLGGGAWGACGTALLEVAARTGLDVRATTLEPVPKGVDGVDPASLADQLLWADVAVLSGGVVKYEAAAVGVPAVLVAMVDHQRDVAELFAREGAAEYAGALAEVDPVGVVARATALLGDEEARRLLWRRGKELVDGQGARRAARELLTVRGD